MICRLRRASVLHDRIAREARLLKAACAAHPLWKADYMYWNWIGDDEAPSQDAMIKWFKSAIRRRLAKWKVAHKIKAVIDVLFSGRVMTSGLTTIAASRRFEMWAT